MPDPERPQIPPTETPWSSPEPCLSPAMVSRVTLAELAVVATRDEAGRPWAWPLAGEPGLVRPLGPGLLRLLPPEPAPLELLWQIARDPTLSVLALDLGGGPGVLAGGGAALAGQRITVALDRAVDVAHDARPRVEATRVAAPMLVAEPALDRWQRRLIATSRTAFLATVDADGGLEIEQRHGWPGFADAALGDAVSLPLLPADERSIGADACLLFLDRDAPGWLQVAVRIERAAPDGLGDARLHCRVAAVVQAFAT